MNKRTKRNLAAFQRAQRRSARYYISRFSTYEKALRENVRRDKALRKVLEKQAAKAMGLLNKANKI